MAERAPQEFDEYASDYEAVINSYIRFFGRSQDFYTRAKANHLLKILKSKTRTNRIDVLDVGCGHGLIHPYLNDSGCQLTGIDVAESAIRMAHRSNPHVTYDVYDGLRLPYRDASFDVLFTICVMHHVPVDQRGPFVDEARRVLRPGGTFIVFEHNKFNPLVQWVVSRIPTDRHAVLLSSWRTQKLLRDAGFRDAVCSYFLFFPLESPVFRKAEAYLTWLPVGAQYYITATK
jgi:SAM-dependent methyltransferase